MSRDLLAEAALRQIPKIITLLDRNPHSPTYGCFDRNAWHYRIIDFPSGMAQEFVWPLALAYTTDHPDNPFHGREVLLDWVRAGIDFAGRSAHADGSCDDYFPYERAAGAAAFSLLACLESCHLLELDWRTHEAFLVKRTGWLASCEESGRLSNHQALIALCLQRAGQLLATTQWDEAMRSRLDRVLEWQHQEGWFPEYDGVDPGYQTLTLWCLARLYEHLPELESLRSALVTGVELTGWFMHPDGSFGGEYSSRNTYNFFPHGFELIGRWMPEALAINDRFLRGLGSDLGSCDADDHIIGHHTWNYLLAWRDFVEPRPEPAARQTGRRHLEDAGLLVDRRDETELYIALNKGGVFKCFRAGNLIASDTQISLLIETGNRARNAVGHLVGDYSVDVSEDEIGVRGKLGWAKQTQMTTWKLIILRLGMMTVGRFFPNLVRRFLQGMLISGKSDAPATFYRAMRWRDGTWHVRDEVRCPDWQRVKSAGIGCDQTSIYVVMSRTFQRGQLQGWLELTPRLRDLEPGAPLVVEREL